MPIGNVIQRGRAIYVYDEKGRQLCMLPAGDGPNGGIAGYTSGALNIRRGNVIYTYDEKGRHKATTSAK